MSHYCDPESLEDFAARTDLYARAADAVCAAVHARMDDDGLNCHSVNARVKSFASLREKLARVNSAGTPKYPSGIRQIDDIIGIRIILFVESDIPKVVQALQGKFEFLEDRDKTQDHKDRGVIGYKSRHLVLRVPSVGAPEGCGPHSGQRFEVQIRTVLQHAWAEFEHDVRYKGKVDSIPEVDRAFTMASALIELADQQFTLISEAVAQRQGEDGQQEILDSAALDGKVLSDVLATKLPGSSRSRSSQYDWLADVVSAMGVTTAGRLSELLDSADWSSVSDAMGYRFEPGHVRIADDYFLSHWREDYIDRTAGIGEDTNRAGKLKARLAKLRSH